MSNDRTKSTNPYHTRTFTLGDPYVKESYIHICGVCEHSNLYQVQIMKYQIILIDKKMASHQFYESKENQCIAINTFQSGKKDYAVFFSVYGIPHCKDKEKVGDSSDCNSNERQKEVRQS